MDTWQAKQVLSAFETLESDSDTPANLFQIRPPYLQLLFARHEGEGVLSNPEVRERLRTAIRASDGSAVRKNKSLTNLGLCPGFITLLSGQVFGGEDADTRRKVREWAVEVIRGCTVRPLKLEEWKELGMETQWAKLIDLQGIAQKTPGVKDPSVPAGENDARTKSLERWRAVLVLLESGSLSPDVLEKSVLKSGKGNLVVTIAGSFGSADPGKSGWPFDLKEMPRR